MPVSLDEIKALDDNGRVLWERTIPLPTGMAGINEFGLLLIMSNGDIVLSATGSGGTEVIRLSPDGLLVKRSEIAGIFDLIQPVFSTENVRIIGWLKSENYKSLSIVSMKKDFIEIDRTKRSVDYISRCTYELPDRSLILFGSKVYANGAGYTSEIIHLDSNIQHERKFLLPTAKILHLTLDQSGRRLPLMIKGGSLSLGDLRFRNRLLPRGMATCPQVLSVALRLTF